MELVCYMPDADFRNQVDQHEPGGKDDIGVKVDFLLAYSLYNVGEDQKGGGLEHIVDAMKDVRQMGRVPRDVLKTGAQSHFFAVHSNLPPRTKLW